MTNELTADGLRELVAGATPGLWQIHSEHGHLREQRCTLIADVDGEMINGSTHYTYKFCAQTLNEFAEGDEFAETNAALIVALVNATPQIIALIEREARMREALETVAEHETDRACMTSTEALEHTLCEIRDIARAALQPKETDDAE